MPSTKTQEQVIEQIPKDQSRFCGEILKVGKKELVKSYRKTKHLYDYMLIRSNQITALTQLQINKLYNNDLEDDFSSLKAITSSYRAQSEDFDSTMSVSSQILYQTLAISYIYLKENADLTKWFSQLDVHKQNLYDMEAKLQVLIDLFDNN